jgi:hypothetical protein
LGGGGVGSRERRTSLTGASTSASFERDSSTKLAPLLVRQLASVPAIRVLRRKFPAPPSLDCFKAEGRTPWDVSGVLSLSLLTTVFEKDVFFLFGRVEGHSINRNTFLANSSSAHFSRQSDISLLFLSFYPSLSLPPYLSLRYYNLASQYSRNYLGHEFLPPILRFVVSHQDFH